jgi:redox-sensitive bicupin YhaK (pirin superfamily)
MIQLRRADERGHADHGWLDTHHTFSFADYYDPKHMGFRALRVINEDVVQAAQGFGTHPHRDMEIVTYVLQGALEHKDSMGTGSVIRPHDVQRMTAGTGVTHSEFNHSKTEPVHLLQIWIEPEKRNLTPSYEEKRFTPEEKRGRWKLIGSRDGREGSVTIHQDVDLFASLLAPGQALVHPTRPKRHTWLQVVRGDVTLNGRELHAGDGVGASGEELQVQAKSDAELLLFDLA